MHIAKIPIFGPYSFVFKTAFTMKKLFLLFNIGIWAIFSIFAQKQQQPLSGDLIIFHAGSLAVPMKEISAAFKKLHPEVNILMESAGSVECARKITDLSKACDILAAAEKCR